MEKEVREKFIEKITEYHNSDSVKEKGALQKEIFTMTKGMELPATFEIAVIAHYDGFKLGRQKTKLESMLRFLPK